MYAVRLYVILLAQGGHVHKILLFCIAFINVSTFLKSFHRPGGPGRPGANWTAPLFTEANIY
jgi:hypothetical protein